jgi:UDP-glucose 4-epimerase
VSVNRVIEIIGQVTGRPVRTSPTRKQMGDMRDTFADTSRARADLGFVPQVQLSDGLAAEYYWLAATPESL